jgi:hypothetical protein
MQIYDEELFITTNEIPVVRKALARHRRRPWWRKLFFWKRKPKRNKWKWRKELPPPEPLTLVQIHARSVRSGKKTRKLPPRTEEIDMSGVVPLSRR